MAKIYFVFSLFLLCLFSQSCTAGSDPGSTGGSNNIVPTSTPIPVPTPTYGTWRMPITLTEKSGNALTDYQVCVDLSTDNIIYSHFLDASGDDLRFFVNSTECSYWIQTWKNGTGSKSQIWVKVPSLAANGTATLEMRYGDASATVSSDGNATMLLYDDFNNGTTIDTTKWRDGSTPTAFINQAAGNMVLNNNYSTNGYRGYLISQAQFEKNISIDARVKLGAASANVYYQCISQFDGLHPAAGDIAQNGYYVEWGAWNVTDSNFNIQRSINSVSTTINHTLATKDLNYHIISLQYFNTQIRCYLDNVLKNSVTDTTDFTTRYIGFSTREQKNPAAQDYLDWVAVRKIVMPEPTVTLGSEQPNP